jgi:CarD family transcriptional regulator
MTGPNAATEWSRRYQANLRRMRSGDRAQIADAERMLSEREPIFGLSRGEQRMLAAAREFLANPPNSSGPA